MAPQAIRILRSLLISCHYPVITIVLHEHMMWSWDSQNCKYLRIRSFKVHSEGID